MLNFKVITSYGILGITTYWNLSIAYPTKPSLTLHWMAKLKWQVEQTDHPRKNNVSEQATFCLVTSFLLIILNSFFLNCDIVFDVIFKTISHKCDFTLQRKNCVVPRANKHHRTHHSNVDINTILINGAEILIYPNLFLSVVLCWTI